MEYVAGLKHHSTFSFYEKGELGQALRVFENRVSTQFSDLNSITWCSEYAMLLIGEMASSRM